MGRPKGGVAEDCFKCVHLRTRRGWFWCRKGYDRVRGLMPQSWEISWLDTQPGRQWRREMAEACGDYEPDVTVPQARARRVKHKEERP